MEPFNLRYWKFSEGAANDTYFYTCARPGRSKGQDEPVPQGMVSLWVVGLPDPTNLALISLLGRKRNRRNLSEFSYYPFRGEWDDKVERKDKASFQEWLDAWHSNLRIQLHEHPTYDYDRRGIPPFILAAIERDVRDLTSAGRTVVVMDSGGVGRTCQVCSHLNATRVSSQFLSSSCDSLDPGRQHPGGLPPLSPALWQQPPSGETVSRTCEHIVLITLARGHGDRSLGNSASDGKSPENCL